MISTRLSASALPNSKPQRPEVMSRAKLSRRRPLASASAIASSAVLASCTPAALQRVTPSGTCGQEVLHSGGQRLDDPEASHLGRPDEHLGARHVRQHVELDLTDRVRPRVVAPAVEVDFDPGRDATEPALGLGLVGVRQPRERHGQLLPAGRGQFSDRIPGGRDRGLHLGDPQRSEVEDRCGQHRVGPGGHRRAGSPRPGRRRRRRSAARRRPRGPRRSSPGRIRRWCRRRPSS